MNQTTSTTITINPRAELDAAKLAGRLEAEKEKLQEALETLRSAAKRLTSATTPEEEEQATASVSIAIANADRILNFVKNNS